MFGRLSQSDRRPVGQCWVVCITMTAVEAHEPGVAHYLERYQTLHAALEYSHLPPKPLRPISCTSGCRP